MVECAGLEIRCTVIPYRGFESHPFRQIPPKFLSSLENPEKSSALSPLVHEEWYTGDSENLKNKPGLVCRNGAYYARVRVPTLLVDLLQKHEVKISLRTKNLNEARAKLPAALIEIHKQFAAVTKVADAVAAPVEEFGRGVLEHIARTWFAPRWRSTIESLWKPIADREYWFVPLFPKIGVERDAVLQDLQAQVSAVGTLLTQ